jgi:hypothetical protein
MELFDDGDVEKRREALLMMVRLVDQYPNYTKTHVKLAGAFLMLKENDHALKVSGDAYAAAPTDEDVREIYAMCMARKAYDLWEEENLTEGFATIIKALQIDGFELQRFAVARHLAKETDQIGLFATECVNLGIDPLQEVDMSELAALRDQ